MKRLFLAVLALASIGVVSVTAVAAAGTPVKSSVVYDSTYQNGPPSNAPSYGPAAYGFNSIGDKITTLAGTARSLSSVTVTLSSFACEQGTWQKDCVTTPSDTFSQPITLTIRDAAGHEIESTQTFNVPFRPSASPKCVGLDNPDHVIRNGGWYQPSSKSCKNGLTDDVTFNFSGQKLQGPVVYAISYPMSTEASNSLNVAVTNAGPSAGSTDPGMWVDGVNNPDFDGGTPDYTPAVQFKASNAG